jgi:hypothetical protein
VEARRVQQITIAGKMLARDVAQLGGRDIDPIVMGLGGHDFD